MKKIGGVKRPPTSKATFPSEQSEVQAIHSKAARLRVLDRDNAKRQPTNLYSPLSDETLRRDAIARPVDIGTPAAVPQGEQRARWYIATLICKHPKPLAKWPYQDWPCKACLLWAGRAVVKLVKTFTEETESGEENNTHPSSNAGAKAHGATPAGSPGASATKRAKRPHR